MPITRTDIEGEAGITVIAIEGDLDASNYLDVINQSQQAYNGGAKYLLIDMSNLRFMASSGLVALHSTALLMQGEQPPDPEYGWGALHSIDQRGSRQENVKLINPQPRVEKTLDKTGFKEIFEIFPDVDEAVASCR